MASEDLALLLPHDPSGRAAKGLIPGLIFLTADVDATFEELRAEGAEVIQEPIDQPYGRDCAFRDPSGNHLRFSQDPKD